MIAELAHVVGQAIVIRVSSRIGYVPYSSTVAKAASFVDPESQAPDVQPYLGQTDLLSFVPDLEAFGARSPPGFWAIASASNASALPGAHRAQLSVHARRTPGALVKTGVRDVRAWSVGSAPTPPCQTHATLRNRAKHAQTGHCGLRSGDLRTNRRSSCDGAVIGRSLIALEACRRSAPELFELASSNCFDLAGNRALDQAWS